MDDVSLNMSGPGDRYLSLLSQLSIGPEIDWAPRHLRTSAWLEHVPFAFWLVKVLRPLQIVELGTHSGVSYGAFCQAVTQLQLPTRCFAIDTWAGDAHAGAYDEEVFRDISAVNEADWASFSTLIRSTFADARQNFPTGEIDILHIDGFHTYEAVSEDFNLWRDALSERGIVLFHDTNERQPDFGVWRLWRQVAERHPHFELVHGHGLGVAAVGRDMPAALQSLFSLVDDAERLAAVRGLFASRGRAVHDRLAAIDLWQWRNGRPSGEAPETSARSDEMNQLREQLRATTDRLQDMHDDAAASSIVLERDRLSQLVATRDAEIAALIDRNASTEVQLAELDAHLEAVAAETARLSAQNDALLRSSSWRITRPLRAATRLIRGQSVERSERATRAISAFQPGAVSANPARAPQTVRAIAGHETAQTAEGMLTAQFSNLLPIAVYPELEAARRVTMITDSVNAGSLFGGVATAINLAALLAERLGVQLRIVTRNDPPNSDNVGAVLQLSGIAYPGNIEFLHCDATADSRGLGMTSDDLVLTTSWWSTFSAIRRIDPRQIIYLLQEDERLFYPAGIQQLLCSEVLQDDRLRFIVNTEMLRQHFIASGISGFASASIAFEPAFPDRIYFPQVREPAAPRRLMFYARPNHARNLFLRGIEVLTAAMESDLFPVDAWEFVLVGADIPRLVFRAGARVRYSETVPWNEYAALVRGADIALSLMYTPHPSYPPLDVAASGGVVVTNRFGTKTSLDRYSANIICVEPSASALLDGLRQARDLVDDGDRRRANFAASHFVRDWRESFAPVLSKIAI